MENNPNKAYIILYNYKYESEGFGEYQLSNISYTADPSNYIKSKRTNIVISNHQ